MPPIRGRHRRPQQGRISQTSLAVTAGSAGLALPLIAAGSANAAADNLHGAAQFESSVDEEINGGDVFRGGRQITGSLPEAHGGTEFMPPDAGPRTAAGNAQAAQGAASRAGARPLAAPATGTPGSRTTDSYRVVSGDSLYGIARTLGVDGGWQRLYDTNREVVGADPDLILPGQRLSLRTAERTPAPRPRDAGKQEKAERETDGRAAAEKDKAEKDTAEKEPAGKAGEQAGGSSGSGAAAAGRKDDARASRAGSDDSARPAGFAAPVPGIGASTPYRSSGGSWSSGYHTGVDFPVATGTSVRAVSAGEVVSAGWGGAYGYQVVLRHSDGRYSQYAHLSQLSVRPGQPVAAGRQVGRSGSTGNSTGPHLHFEVRTGPGYGSDIDPLGYLRAHGVTI